MAGSPASQSKTWCRHLAATTPMADSTSVNLCWSGRWGHCALSPGGRRLSANRSAWSAALLIRQNSLLLVGRVVNIARHLIIGAVGHPRLTLEHERPFERDLQRTIRRPGHVHVESDTRTPLIYYQLYSLSAAQVSQQTACDSASVARLRARPPPSQSAHSSFLCQIGRLGSASGSAVES